jgi:glycosyltransferase involved in cell wall biosynthesis
MSNHPSLNRRASQTYTYPIGVIIPTYNRSEVLLSCLKHLEQQTWTDFEVIIVDDGSTDSTPQLLEQYQCKSPLHLRYIRQDNSGPARARNVAIAALHAPICLMIGDDILASPVLISTHLQLHQQKPEIEVAALGLTRWSDSGQTVTKFMRWLDDSGMQFAYNDLLRGVCPSWKHFYTSNLSLKTEILRENPFNEMFRKAAMEDIELGYRLHVRRCLKMAFVPQAFASHYHPTNFRKACKRAYGIGESSKIFQEIWPEHRPSGGNSFRRAARNLFFNNRWLLYPLTEFADFLTHFWCPNPLMRELLNLYSALGQHDNSLPNEPPRQVKSM